MAGVRRWTFWFLVCLALTGAGIPGGTTLYRQANYGDRYGEDERDITVTTGALFSVVVADRGLPAGDRWTASIADTAVVSPEYSALVADGMFGGWFGLAAGGDGGQRLITFRARALGRTTITVRNTGRTQAQSRFVRWTVHVPR